ncbi:MAG: cytochrome c-type biogenesis protein CcmH [Hyphomicrobiaceae bacterium]
MITGLVVAGSGGRTLAVEPDEILADPVLESRARTLSAELRCLVCQNQSIDESNAPLARDLRLLVRERLKAGDKDGDILDYIVARYGEFVLLRPRFSGATLLLWLSPVLLLVVAIWLARGVMRRQRPDAAARDTLSEEEQRRLAEMLKEPAERS